MDQSGNPSQWARDLARRMSLTIISDDDFGLPAISHRLLIAAPGHAVPLTFTVDLSPDQRGTFLVTCREVPDVVIFAEDEDEALAGVEVAIKDALGSRPASPDSPY